MKQLRNIFIGLLFALGLLVSLPALAQEEITPGEQKENTVDVKSIVFGHIGDSYEAYHYLGQHTYHNSVAGNRVQFE